MAQIPVGRKKEIFAEVDDEDYERAIAIKWTPTYMSGRVYAVNGRSGATLHRFIIDAPDGVSVRILDGNALNCTKANLELIKRPTILPTRKYTPRGSKPPVTTSKYGKHILYDADESHSAKPWHPFVHIIEPGSLKLWVGYFATEEEALKAYRSEAQIYLDDERKLTDGKQLIEWGLNEPRPT
jgi:hypothetical protein